MFTGLLSKGMLAQKVHAPWKPAVKNRKLHEAYDVKSSLIALRQ